MAVLLTHSPSLAPLLRRQRWSPDDARSDRWRNEVAFFDQHATERSDGAQPLSRAVVERYACARQPWFHKEYRFRLLGDLTGKKVLDVGSGTGENSILLAYRGADVTGVDISPQSTELAASRASASGVATRTRFVCAPIEAADLEPRSFDVVWCDGILHHVLDDLEGVLASVALWARPGALFLFSEPVNLFPLLRRLRERIPVVTEHTPGERPLLAREVELVRRFVPDLALRHFHMLGRLNRFVLGGWDLENAAARRQAVARALTRIDYAALALPLLRRAGGMAVMHGHLRA
jgi:2-polyprenyl-3-methyl-5-hydroxy-6-metoxy-1,4-benzoquinol methylase